VASEIAGDGRFADIGDAPSLGVLLEIELVEPEPFSTWLGEDDRCGFELLGRNVAWTARERTRTRDRTEGRE
jgi:hypothetical protein